jgi:Protein of unknown function (DUF1415)
MAVVQTVERLITKRNWDGLLQVAPFHPQFQFAGSSSANDPDNRTNQSPHPMIHILREDDVSRAVEQLPNQDAAVVWSRNVDVLNELADALEPSDFDTVMTRGIQGLPKFVPPQPATSSSTSMANQTVDMSTGDNNVRSLVRQILGRFRTPLLSTTKERNDSAETQQ